MDLPVSSVLETYELLERILLNVPMKQLFVVRRTSKAWSYLIERSQSLQKRMFLLADGEPLKPVRSGTAYRLEYQHSALLNPAVHLVCAGEIHIEDGQYTAQDIPFPGQISALRTADSRLFVIFELASRRENALPPGRWRDMLLTQPPLTAMRFHALRDKENINVHSVYCTIYRPLGITLYDAFDLQTKFSKEHFDQTGARFGDVWFDCSLRLPPKEGENAVVTRENNGLTSAIESCVCDRLSTIAAQ